MATDSRFRLGKFTKCVIVFGLIAGVCLGVRPLLPAHMRHEIDDFFKRPFVPHFILPINGFKPVAQQQFIDEMTARGFNLTCYGNLAATEKISPKDDHHCWTILKSAFDNIPARQAQFWFQNGILVHAKFEFPSEEFKRLHAYLNRLLDPEMAAHLRPDNNLGVDIFGHPIMSWYTPTGTITVNGVQVPNQNNALLWSSWAVYNLALDKSDVGTYAVVDQGGQATDFAFFVSLSGDTWNVDQRNPDGSWSSVSCEENCLLHVSDQNEIKRFFPPDTLEDISPSCVSNKAFAFCNYFSHASPEKKGYLFIGLVTPQPTPLTLKKLSAERITP